MAVAMSVVIVSCDGMESRRYYDRGDNHYTAHRLKHEIEGAMAQLDTVGNAPVVVINYVEDNEYLADSDQNAKTMIMTIMGMPCATLLLFGISLLVFFAFRYRVRNRVIRTAIENNYTLPDQFYTGRPNTVINIYETQSVMHYDIPQVPAGYDASAAKSKARRAMRRNGLTSSMPMNKTILLIALGVALLIFGLGMKEVFFFALAFVPLIIGCFQLYLWYRGVDATGGDCIVSHRDNFSGTSTRQHQGEDAQQD